MPLSRVILQPAGSSDARAHYQDTIERPVPIDRIAKFVEPAILAELERLYPGGEVPIWGVTPGTDDVNRRKWDRISRGDVTLFARGKQIVSTAVTTRKFHNPDLAEALWGRDEKGQTWEFIYCLDDVQVHEIPYEVMNEAAGYAPNYVVQGFNVLDEEKSSRILTWLDLEPEEHTPPVSSEEYAEIQLPFKPHESLDRQILVRIRREQAYLRQALLGDEVRAECGICTDVLPVGFLDAAHIKRRADCTRDERTDVPAIVMPMCKFGCHNLYDRGYVTVLDGGRTEAFKPAASSPPLDRWLERLHDHTSPYWSDDRAGYFEWHATNVFRG